MTQLNRKHTAEEHQHWSDLYDSTEGLAAWMEDKVLNSDWCPNYNDVDAISAKAWDWFIEQPEEYLEEFNRG